MRYIIRTTSTAFLARGATIELAALHAARRLYGRTVSVVRATGTRGLSGYFQAYRPIQPMCQTSVGTSFHITLAPHR